MHDAVVVVVVVVDCFEKMILAIVHGIPASLCFHIHLVLQHAHVPVPDWIDYHSRVDVVAAIATTVCYS